MGKQKSKPPSIEATKLYQVALSLTKHDRETLGLRIPVKIFLQDPLVAEKHKKKGVLGIEEIYIDWEPGLTDGPTSARVAVVDYNADTGILAEPAKWDPEAKRFMDADDSDSFHFHQVNVWAIVQNTLAFYEDPYVMGRPISWGFDGNRLVVIPHAGVMKNAFYDRQSKTLQFYYACSRKNQVFTCLSHDIVSHETGHAILDGIRPYYYEISSAQTAAFHEFLADLTSILSALRNNSVRHAVAEISNGDLRKDTIIADLAEQFAQEDIEKTYGDAQRYYLRTANNDYNMEYIKDKWEPHDCSQVLTGIMYEILTEITKLHMEKYGLSAKQALWKGVDHLNRLAFRALDYCPPVDIQFIDYARAVLRANELAYPIDTLGYTKIVKEVFERRGLVDLDPLPSPVSIDLIWKYDLSTISSSRTAAYHFLNDNRGKLEIPISQDIEISDIYVTDKVVGANKKLPREVIIEYIWREDVVLENKVFGQFNGQVIPLLCGGTIVFDERGNILYWSKKSGTQIGEDEKEGKDRKENLLDYVKKLIRAGVIGLVDEGGAMGLDIDKPAVLCRRFNGSLHLEMTSNLLNKKNNQE